MAIVVRLRELARLVREGHGRRVLRAVLHRWYSRSRTLGLRRDLSRPLTPAAARLPLTVRPLAPSDSLPFLEDRASAETDANDRVRQRRLLADGIGTCWVAVTDAGQVCYMQWLIPASDNERVQRRWPGLFPSLARDEALLEGAYTPESFRGRGIMAHAMAIIAAHAAARDARWVITFVGDDNIPSLKGCYRAGFAPYVERQDRWIGFRRRTRFGPLPEGAERPGERTAWGPPAEQSPPARAAR